MSKVDFQYEDLGIDYRDLGPWRSYQITCSGDTLAECLATASIEEVDQDGGTLDCYDIEDVPNNEIYQAALDTINACLRRAEQESA